MQRLDDLVVVGWSSAKALGTSLPDALCQHLDDVPGEPQYMSPDELMTADLRRSTKVVWLIAGGGSHDDDLFDVLDLLAEQHLTTVLTRVGETMPTGSTYGGSAVVLPPDVPIEQVAGLLRCMHSQAEAIATLSRELSITQRHHGGLRGQMDKLDEELRLAARVQQESLPTRLPRVGDVQVDVMFRPAGYVSGDVYDVQRLDEDHVGIWIADVVGHGVPAALLTMFVKAALPTKEITSEGYRIVPPCEALAKLNQEMVERATGQSRFATACYAVLNCRTRELQVARAGHPLPIVLRGDGELEYLNPDGPLLGVFPDEPLSASVASSSPGTDS
jgi:sigma-B regulation protein RsbU (phosphoserine phosphatase)